MNKKHLYQKRAKTLNKGKVKTLSFFEKTLMKFAGYKDGKHKLIKKDESDNWMSCNINMILNSYKEFCSRLFGNLKYEDEEEFKNISILCNKICSKNKKFEEEKQRLAEALETVPNNTTRKAGEEKMTIEQIITRRNRERKAQIDKYSTQVESAEKDLKETVSKLVECISTIKEDYNTTCRISNRILNHCQQKMDTYWRAAMKQLPELPPTLNLSFYSASKDEYCKHYLQVVSKAEDVLSTISLNS